MEFIIIRNLQLKRLFCVSKVWTVLCPSTMLSPREGLWPDSSRAVKQFGEDADPRVALGCERLWQAQPPCPGHTWERRSGPAGRSRSSFRAFRCFPAQGFRCARGPGAAGGLSCLGLGPLTEGAAVDTVPWCDLRRGYLQPESGQKCSLDLPAPQGQVRQR